MTSYDDVIEKIRENDISWKSIDRLELHEDTHMDFYARQSGNRRLSNYETDDQPAVRVTTLAEKIVYIDDDGEIHELKL